MLEINRLSGTSTNNSLDSLSLSLFKNVVVTRQRILSFQLTLISVLELLCSSKLGVGRDQHDVVNEVYLSLKTVVDMLHLTHDRNYDL